MSKSPTEPSAVVLSFGKHRGATVAELLAKDPQYADWLMGQAWLAERFAEVHAAIASRGAGTDDTPEHNALQARFLEPGFREAFLRVLYPEKLKEERQKVVEDNLWAERAAVSTARRDLYVANESLAKLEGWLREKLAPGSGWASDDKYIAELRRRVSDAQNNVGQCHDKLQEAEPTLAERRALVEAGSSYLFTEVKFEQRGVDVVVAWVLSLEPKRPPDIGHAFSHGEWLKTYIELKPSIGDDYPTIMRQMQRLGASVVVAQTFSGRGVSEASLCAMLKANGYSLVFVRDIEAEAVKAQEAAP